MLPAHHILTKTQTDVITTAGGSPIEQKGTTYDWRYSYDEDKGHPHAPIHIGNRSFDYDLNGNQTGWQSDVNGTRRYISWDEENRISEIDDNGHRNQYVYDAAGERVIKTTQQGETVYVNQYYVVRNRSIVSKHLYAGTSRIVTHLVMGTAPGNNGQGAPGNGGGNGNANGSSNGNATTGHDNNGQHLGQEKDHSNNGLHLGQLKNGTMDKTNPGQGRERRSDTADAHAQDVYKNPTLTGNFPGQGLEHRSDRANSVAQNTRLNPNLIISEAGASVELGGDTSGGESTSGTTTSVSTSSGGGQSDFLYFYHPDHLGSTGFVTDQNGELYEHMEYFPFGETWVQEHTNTLRTPYLYTGKELDQETGLYYYGARYYDPRTSVWQSADPILGKYLPTGNKEHDTKLPGMGGVFTPSNLGLYSYVRLNPLLLVDPDGNSGELYVVSRGTGILFNSGHSFIIYVPDAGTGQYKSLAPSLNSSGAITWSTWGNHPNKLPNGLQVNIDKFIGGEAMRRMHIDDAGEAALLDKVKQLTDMGEDAWKVFTPCSDTARALWDAGTGEKLNANSWFISNPAKLKDSITKANGGYSNNWEQMYNDPPDNYNAGSRDSGAYLNSSGNPLYNFSSTSSGGAEVLVYRPPRKICRVILLNELLK